ncbi:ATP-dependent DNA helicase [Trichonephila clavipes]|nr:ATP-dependent DNA helicase [Trichonephila clavipes]
MFDGFYYHIMFLERHAAGCIPLNGRKEDCHMHIFWQDFFLLSLILATVRSQNNIALAIASSGIAATLLDGGRTTHSALKLPLNLQNTEAPTCNIRKNSGMGKVLQTCQIIIWDECTMSHKKALEALDRTLRDFKGNRRILGGALILLSGDFRQTLPIISRSTPADELHACHKSSVLWRHLQKLGL